MKSKEQQIEEMAKDIYSTGIAIDGTDIAYGVYDNDDHFHRMARKLYAAGYRKQSDVVREIISKAFERIFPTSEYDGIELIGILRELAAEFGAEVDGQ